LSELEKRLGLIHRIIVPDQDHPREYAILVTDQRSIFLRQPTTRSSFVLRGEMRYGTALVTDVIPKKLEDFEQTSLESLANDSQNLSVPHQTVSSLVVRRGEPEFRLRDFFIWLTMRRQGHMFRVYDFELHYRKGENPSQIKFFLVPLGMYFKPKRQTQTRADILHDYAMEALRVYQSVLSSSVITKPDDERN